MSRSIASLSTTTKSPLTPREELLDAKMVTDNSSPLSVRSGSFLPGFGELMDEEAWECCQCNCLTCQDSTTCLNCGHEICRECDDGYE